MTIGENGERWGQLKPVYDNDPHNLQWGFALFAGRVEEDIVSSPLSCCRSRQEYCRAEGDQARILGLSKFHCIRGWW